MGCSDSYKYRSRFRQNRNLFNIIQNVGFLAHVNGVYSNDDLEVCLEELSIGSFCMIPFDTTKLNYTYLDRLYDKQNSNEDHLIPLTFKGKMTQEDGKKLYFKKDEGKNLLVAMLGFIQKECFESCGLNTVDKWTDLKLDIKLDELDDYPTPFMKCHQEQIHLGGFDHNCSRRIAYKIMHYLKKIKNAN
ncbi:hypothetical protein NPIL_258991 [Nephila pilipes]|uniref:Uncharacterized protein n=1 Tax=Nephila pilipes TaxID=299642 RepID=A0A8X6UIW3_NEPPI|nr:hypothetical protein NPIL_258991 [Nephila pilipes]